MYDSLIKQKYHTLSCVRDFFACYYIKSQKKCLLVEFLYSNCKDHQNFTGILKIFTMPLTTLQTTYSANKSLYQQ